MKEAIAKLLKMRERLMPFIVPAIYLSAMALVIGKLDISLYLKAASMISLSVFGMLSLPGFGSHMRTWSRTTLMLVGLCGIGVVLSYRLGNLWIDHHGYNGAVWSVFARVINRHGFLKTQGCCYWTGGSQFVPAAIYDHHPAGLVWILSLAFRLCGVHEATARAIPVIFSMLGVGSLMVFLTRTKGVPAAVAIFPVLFASPGFAYFGRMVNFEPIVIGIALIFYSWLLLQPATRWATYGLVFTVLVAPLMGWVGTPFAMGAAFALAKRRFGWSNLPSLAFILLPLAIFAFCVLHNANWGRDLVSALSRAGAWNSLLDHDMADYGFAAWLCRIAKNAIRLMPWPLWVLVAFSPFLGLERNDVILLLGTLVPFLIMIPLMSHAVYIHDYHMLFWWPAAAISFACLIARSRPPVVALVVSLLMLYPVALGLRTTQNMHRKVNYALHQSRVGMNLNAISNPAATVAVINTAGDPAPILAYYLDRHYQVYTLFDLDRAVSGWDYYCLMHKYRGLSDADQMFLNKHFTAVPDSYVPTFTLKATQ
ncbi:MAG: ArnT family glycosyltransferase [Kiritimatiellia bacterium]